MVSHGSTEDHNRNREAYYSQVLEGSTQHTTRGYTERSKQGAGREITTGPATPVSTGVPDVVLWHSGLRPDRSISISTKKSRVLVSSMGVFSKWAQVKTLEAGETLDHKNY